mgnify:FL=1
MLIALDHVTKFYEVAGEKNAVLKNVSLVISEGDFVGIMGRSGSGKSTLVNLIGFLDKQFSGDYYFEDKLIGEYTDDDLSKIRNEYVGFVFQNFGLIETMTVAQNVELPLLYSAIPSLMKSKLVSESLKQVGLENFSNQSVKLLSGGQR